MPRVSVILPIYNGMPFIANAVDSILAQAYQDFELILIDDCSNDGTMEILNKFTDSRIQLVKNTSNLGLVGSLNKGLKIASGEYIARMDHDDIAMPSRFDRQVKFLDQNSEVSILGTGYRLVDASGRLGLVYTPPESHDELEWALSFMCPLAHPTVMMRRSVVELAGGYLESASYAEDYDLWERLSYHSRFANIADSLLLLRKHSANMSKVWSNNGAVVSAAVVKKRIDYLLGGNLSDGTSKCLYSQGAISTHNSVEAVEAIVKLYRIYSAKSPLIKKKISRDAAIRCAVIGIRANSVPDKMRCILSALKLYPFFINTLLIKFVKRLLGFGSLNTVG